MLGTGDRLVPRDELEDGLKHLWGEQRPVLDDGSAGARDCHPPGYVNLNTVGSLNGNTTTATRGRQDLECLAVKRMEGVMDRNRRRHGIVPHSRCSRTFTPSSATAFGSRSMTGVRSFARRLRRMTRWCSRWGGACSRGWSDS